MIFLQIRDYFTENF